MCRLDISNEIITTLHTILSTINANVNEAQMLQNNETNVIQLRLPVRNTKSIIMHQFIETFNCLESWQQSQILASLRDISKTIYATADECVEMAEITNAISK